MAEISPSLALSAGPKSASGIPFSMRQAQEQDDSQPPPHEEKVDKVGGGAEVKPN